MGTLSKDKLIEYIRHAIDLEGAVVTQEFIKREYVNISQANKPKLLENKQPNKPYAEVAPKMGLDWAMAAVVSIFGGIFVFSICCSHDDPLMGLIVGLLMCIPGFFIIGSRVKHEFDVEKRNTQLEEKYVRELSEYENKKRDNEQQYRDSMTLWQASDTEALAFIDEHLDEAHSDAEKYYARNVIFEKYRNLPALTSIYEYLLSGRCDGLEGPNGAYNIYEMEVRQNTVISQLNVIIENLEQIKQNQYILYGELVKISNETSAITAEMRRISGYTYSLVQLSSLNAYYSAAAASAASAMAFDMALR